MPIPVVPGTTLGIDIEVLLEAFSRVSPKKKPGKSDHSDAGKAPSNGAVPPHLRSVSLDDDTTLTADNVVLQEQSKRSDTLVGEVIAKHFRIDARLADGGMSTVYKAKDLLLGRDVAIKVLLPGRHFTEESLLRFQREAKTVGVLSHPSIVSVYEMNTYAEGEPYIAMEYVEGETLATHIKNANTSEAKGLPVEMTIDIMRQCAAALSYAHKHGVIHRDIKSGNIMLARDEDGAWRAKLVDFGIARALEEDAINLTRTGDIFGSPRYMSPEQCRGEKIDARSDIYSLGCVFYECLTGEVPFKGGTVLDTMRMHNDDSAVAPSSLRKGMQLGAEIDRIVLKSLAKDRNGRYQTAEALEADLQKLSGLTKSSLGSVVAGSVRKISLGGKGRKSLRGKLFFLYFLLSAAFLVWFALNQGYIMFDGVWSDLDYKGQKAFDKGEYKQADDNFRLALKIAETLPVHDRSLKLIASYTELADLATAKDGKDSAKEWIAKRDAQTESSLGDETTYRGQQYALCKNALQSFIKDSKDPHADKSELKQRARNMLEKFNELSDLFVTLESLEGVYSSMSQALVAASPYLEKTDSKSVEALVNRAWLGFYSNAANPRELVAEAESSLRESSDASPILKARCLSLLSQVHLVLGQREPARRCSEESIEILREHADMRSDAAVHALLNRALVEDETRHPDTADFFFNQAKFEMQKKAERNPGIREKYTQVRLSLLSNRGATLHALQEAKEILDQEERHPTSRRLLVTALFTTGALSGWLGAQQDGMHLLERCAAVAQTNRQPANSAVALDMIGEVLGAHKKYDEALPYIRRARDSYNENKTLYANSIVATSNNLALLLGKKGNFDEAILVLKEAEPLLSLPTFGAPKFKEVLYHRLASLYEKKGDQANAQIYKAKYSESLKRK